MTLPYTHEQHAEAELRSRRRRAWAKEHAATHEGRVVSARERAAGDDVGRRGGR